MNKKRNILILMTAATALLLAACADDIGTTNADATDDARLEGNRLALVAPNVQLTMDNGQLGTRADDEGNASYSDITLHTHLMGKGGTEYFTKSDNTPAAATYTYTDDSKWSSTAPLRVSSPGTYYMRAVAQLMRTADGTTMIATTATSTTIDTSTGATPGTGTAKVEETSTAGAGTTFTLGLVPLSAQLRLVLRSSDGNAVTAAQYPSATIDPAGKGHALRWMDLTASGFTLDNLKAETWPTAPPPTPKPPRR